MTTSEHHDYEEGTDVTDYTHTHDVGIIFANADTEDDAETGASQPDVLIHVV
jgi:hypothetical protein